MAYSTQSDIINQLSETVLAEITDDVNGAIINAVTVTAMIAKADNQINSYCRGKNTLPFNTITTPRVLDWSVSLAIWNLYKRRVDISMPEAIETDHNDVISELKGVRDSTILVNDPVSVANTASYYKGSGGDKGVMFDSNSEGTGVLDKYYNGPL